MNSPTNRSEDSDENDSNDGSSSDTSSIGKRKFQSIPTRSMTLNMKTTMMQETPIEDVIKTFNSHVYLLQGKQKSVSCPLFNPNQPEGDIQNALIKSVCTLSSNAQKVDDVASAIANSILAMLLLKQYNAYPILVTAFDSMGKF